MSFLKDRFFLLNSFKNLLIFSVGILIFLSLFDFIFNQTVEWTSNLVQGFFLSFILIQLNNFTDYRKLKSLSVNPSISSNWHRNAMIDGSADLTLQSVIEYLHQDKKVADIEPVDPNNVRFKLRYNAYLAAMDGEINIVDRIVRVQLSNNGFFHFGAAASIHLHIFLVRMEEYFHPS